MIVLMNALFDFVLLNFVPEILASKMSPRSGRPTIIQDEDLRTLVETDPLQTVRGLAEELGDSSVLPIKLNKYSLRYYSLN